MTTTLDTAPSARLTKADDSILAAGRTALLDRPELRHVELHVDGDRVLLVGQVPSFHAKQLAQELVKETGVFDLANQLRVEPRRRDDNLFRMNEADPLVEM